MELKPCPFCGSKDVCIYDNSVFFDMDKGPLGYHWVECLDCDARSGNHFDADSAILGYENGKDGAIAAWNIRADKE